MKLANCLFTTLTITLLVCGTLLSPHFCWGGSVTEAPASTANMAYPLPDKPSFAILPFENVAGNSELEFLSDGVTDDLTLELSRVPAVFVIAIGATHIYKGKSVTVNEVSEELGVQYVIEGSVQKLGEQLRITARMTDALKGDPVWSAEYDRNMDDIFKIYEDILFKITKSVGLKSPKLGPTPNLDGYLKYLQAVKYYYMQTRDGPPKAKPFFEEAIAIDPDYSPFYAEFSFLHSDLARYYSSGESSVENFEKGLELAQKAIELDNSNDSAYVALGYNYMCQKKPELALSNFEKASALNPLNARAYSEAATCLTWIDKKQESISYYQKAIRLNPMGPGNYVRLGRAYYHLKQYEDAIRMHEKCLEIVQKGIGAKWWAHLHLAMVYGELGREAEARAHMEKLLEYWPKFNLEDRRKSLHFKDPTLIERELNALRKAGAPEHPPSK
ncbi:MAG: tetratricopeptide repeat protein [Desulfobacterales bacterium]|nr:tetratricopeptide repeat protein [Desulfobacterales bacterium]